jgi:tetratricopeptide (TPR) repeat protein
VGETVAVPDQFTALLAHEDAPRGALFMEFPTGYGTLRLDCPGDDPESLMAAGGAPVPDETRQAVERALAGDDLGARIDVLRQAAGAHPMVAGFHANLSLSYRRAGDPMEALYHARQAVAVDQSFGRLAMLATSYGIAGRMTEALALFDHLWDLRAEADPVMRAGAAQDHMHTLLLSEQWEQLAEVAALVSAEDPADANAAAQLATARHRLGRPHEVKRQVMDLLDSDRVDIARTVVDRVLAGATGQDWFTGYSLVYELMARGFPLAALSALDRIFDLPELPDEAMPIILHLRENLEQTWGVGQVATLSGFGLALHRAVAHHVRSPHGMPGPDQSFGPLEVHLPPSAPDVSLTSEPSQQCGAEMGQIQHRQATDLQGARAHAADLARRYPFIPDAHALLSELCANLGDHEAAIYEARQAMALRPSYSYLYLLGTYLRAAGRQREALLVLNHVWVHRALAPNLRVARHARLNYYMALHTKSGTPVMLSVAKDAAAEDPDDEITLYYLALAQLNAGEPAASKSTMDELVRRTGPGHPLWASVSDLSPLVDRAVG